MSELTPEWKRFTEYIASFDIEPRAINLKTITNTGYDKFVEMDGGVIIPVFRPWPTSMDVPYLFQLGMAAIESERENEVSN